MIKLGLLFALWSSLIGRGLFSGSTMECGWEEGSGCSLPVGKLPLYILLLLPNEGIALSECDVASLTNQRVFLQCV